jgi:hypothetical protein
LHQDIARSMMPFVFARMIKIHMRDAGYCSECAHVFSKMTYFQALYLT